MQSIARAWFTILLWATLWSSVQSVLQTEAIDVYLGDDEDAVKSYTMFVSSATFGPLLKMGPEENPRLSLSTPPSHNPLLCQNVTTTQQTYGSHSVIMVPRGECSFLIKALNAQKLGAKAMLVHGTLASRYTLNTTDDNANDATMDDIIYPAELNDYDCSNGRALVPASAISFDPLPYNAEHNDPVLSGSDASQNLCLKNSPDSLASCPSQACLLTGKPVEDHADKMEACCAWDFAIWLYGDAAGANVTVDIPAAYVTMEQGNVLLSDLNQHGDVTMVLYERPRSNYQMSSALIWALGVVVAALAAYLSAADYHWWIRKMLRRNARRAQEGARPSTSARPSVSRRSSSQPEETLELTAWHALGFIIMASSSLLLLFYLKIYNLIKFMYAIGCSKAVSQVLFYPLIGKIMKRTGHRDVIVWRTGTEDFGDITMRDVVSHICGFALGLAWVVVACLNRHPEEVAFFWITQNIFGACMCIMFAQVIKLNSIRVASILLIVAFFYDIFFVFITPLIFKKSVMITVATSGGPPSADPAWCEKYPDDPDCQGGDPLPMLLTIPRIGDYQGGASLLGLGDIVLPGLLLSFAARFDAAKIMLGLRGGGNGSLTAYNCPEQKYFGSCCTGGYFPPLVVAYAVGLMMANVAVSLMKMGQPALLYLVPCCLGTMCYMGWRRNELKDLWEGPKIVRAADELIHGEHQPTAGHAALPMEEGEDALEVPSAEDADDDLQDLLEETNP